MRRQLVRAAMMLALGTWLFGCSEEDGPPARCSGASCVDAGGATDDGGGGADATPLDSATAPSDAPEQLPDAGIQCGGFAGTPCPGGLTCVDDPTDDCDPMMGGADCIGICVR